MRSMAEVGGHRAAPRYPVGRLIRERRLALGFTQEEAARAAGVSVGAWRSTEAGTRRPRPQTFAAILAMLDLTPAEIHELAIAPRPVELSDARQMLEQLCRERLPDDLVEPVLLLLDAVVETSRT